MAKQVVSVVSEWRSVAPTVETHGYSSAELMACVFARQITDNSMVGVPGVRSEVALAAVGLAARLYTQNLLFVNMSIIRAQDHLRSLTLTGFTFEYERLRSAPAIYEQDRFYDLLHRGSIDYMFGGGMQIDQWANTNTVAVGGWERPTLRGPGGAGLSSVTYAQRYFLWLNEHSTRVFVPEVDFISAAGPHARRKAGGYRPGGVPDVATPLATFSIEPDTLRLSLRSVHEGVDPATVVRNTGFDLGPMDGEVPVTAPPTPEELATLRNEVDPRGILREEQPYG